MEKFPTYKSTPVADLIPYARNSRTHSEAQVSKIAASIKEFGFLSPIVVDGENGIIAGHGRVMAAKKLGMIEVPCIEAAHLTSAQRRAYVIADNRLALDAGWNDDFLRAEILDIANNGFEIAIIGFDKEELSKLFDETAGIKIDEIEDEKIDRIIVKFDPEDRVNVINAVTDSIAKIKNASVWADE